MFDEIPPINMILSVFDRGLDAYCMGRFLIGSLLPGEGYRFSDSITFDEYIVYTLSQVLY